jgi:hypothetical protein
MVLGLCSCSGFGVSFGSSPRGYYDPWYDSDFFDPPFYAYDGLWHDGYVYWNGRWYYQGRNTPYWWQWDDYGYWY